MDFETDSVYLPNSALVNILAVALRTQLEPVVTLAPEGSHRVDASSVSADGWVEGALVPVYTRVLGGCQLVAFVADALETACDVGACAVPKKKRPGHWHRSKEIILCLALPADVVILFAFVDVETVAA